MEVITREINGKKAVLIAWEKKREWPLNVERKTEYYIVLLNMEAEIYKVGEVGFGQFMDEVVKLVARGKFEKVGD